MNKKCDDLIWLWFSLLPSIGAQRGKLLLGEEAVPVKLWNRDISELNRIKSLGGEFYNLVCSESIRETAKILYEKYFSNNFMKLVSIVDDEYPDLLSETPGAPHVIFYRGNIKYCNDVSMGVIGTRKPTAYGVNCARDLSRTLAEAGFCIVSGMARGIDSEAHTATLQVGGKTCAVLGCGLDRIYPPENKKLYDIIVDRGVVISEYPPETLPLPQNFPARNRIISGLCNGLLVIEAGKRSGTLITVDFAAEQGRDVFAVPGSIFSKKSEGTNFLIKQGAFVVTAANDILDEYSFESREVSTKTFSGIRGELIGLVTNGSSTIDDILLDSSYDHSDIMAELMFLEAEGLINKLPTGEYSIGKGL